MALDKLDLKDGLITLAEEITEKVLDDRSVNTIELNATGLAEAISNYVQPLVDAYNDHSHNVSTTGSSTSQTGSTTSLTPKV